MYNTYWLINRLFVLRGYCTRRECMLLMFHRLLPNVYIPSKFLSQIEASVEETKRAATERNVAILPRPLDGAPIGLSSTWLTCCKEELHELKGRAQGLIDFHICDTCSARIILSSASQKHWLALDALVLRWTYRALTAIKQNL